MISCQLNHVTHNPQGLPVCHETRIAGESLSIGRDPACTIHLPDHRVGLLHAVIQRAGDGTLSIHGVDDQHLRIQDCSTQSAALAPGMRIEIGPCLLSVGTAATGHDLALSIEWLHPLPDPKRALETRSTALSLAALKLSKRKAGWLLSVGILILFFLLPLLPYSSDTLHRWSADLPVHLTTAWNPGPLATGHRLFDGQCSLCHARAFRAVKDESCLACHKQLTVHLADKEQQTDGFKEIRCTHCHQDHNGKNGLIAADAGQCVVCHGDIKSWQPKATIADIHDFDTDHPPFHLALPTGKGLVRVKIKELAQHQAEPGLKMSHKIHMDKKGVSSPLGNQMLSCQDCHRPDESGQHFQPMSMQKTCQQSRCHRIYFDEPVEGRVPHGSVRELMQIEREFHLKWLTDPAVDAQQVCGPSDATATSPIQSMLACANRLARQNAATLFKKKINCDMCHETEPTEDPDLPWKVTPLRIPRDWQPGASFMHAKHATTNCTTCHDKLNTTTSAEISMPDIEQCRKCHVGDHDVPGKVRTGCSNCHRFHRHAAHKAG